tara:strand:- start:110 stop:457 length:348 start_codon:yes stop_codon:yes gene_type:complete
MTTRNTAEVANKVRADLVKDKLTNEMKALITDDVFVINQKNKPYKAEHFKDDLVMDLMSYLVRIPGVADRANLIELEKLKKMTDEEIRSAFAEKLNDGSLTFSTYTMNHLNKRKE